MVCVGSIRYEQQITDYMGIRHHAINKLCHTWVKNLTTCLKMLPSLTSSNETKPLGYTSLSNMVAEPEWNSGSECHCLPCRSSLHLFTDTKAELYLQAILLHYRHISITHIIWSSITSRYRAKLLAMDSQASQHWCIFTGLMMLNGTRLGVAHCRRIYIYCTLEHACYICIYNYLTRCGWITPGISKPPTAESVGIVENAVIQDIPIKWDILLPLHALCICVCMNIATLCMSELWVTQQAMEH